MIGSLVKEQSNRWGVRISRFLWSGPSKPFWLLAGAALLLLVMLGSRELWTHEGRWALICQEMLRSGDFLHPYLYGQPYYDKPLASYWLMIGFARLFGGLNEWALRLPSALSGILAVWCTYRLGRKLFGPSTGLLAGWILVTCFFFVFWSRTAGADMLNLAGSVAAVAWFFERKDRPGFLLYFIFFLILTATSLMKGLIGAAIPVLVVLPPLLSGYEWRKHLRPSLILAAITAGALYFLPFILSTVYRGNTYGASGLAMAFRENLVRFFRPFDHTGHILTYVENLPIYMLPWTPFLPLVVWRAVREWEGMDGPSRWPVWATLLIFGFLTASGSRRSYYILPILPFVSLMTADWVLNKKRKDNDRPATWAAWITVGSFLSMFLWLGIVQPFQQRLTGMRPMAQEVHETLGNDNRLANMDVILYGVPPKAGYYLGFGKRIRLLATPEEDPAVSLKTFFAENPNVMVITCRKYQNDILPHLRLPTIIQEKSRLPQFLRTGENLKDEIVVLIPRSE